MRNGKKLIGVLTLSLAAAALAAGAAAQEKGAAPAKPAAAATQPAPAPAKGAAAAPAFRDPAALTKQAPATFKAKFETSQGVIVIEATRDWAPVGVDRFYNLVQSGYFENVRFFRVVPNFVVQFGIHGDPSVSKNWMNAKLKDEPVKEGNKRGTLTYAKSSAPNSRTTQIFINLKDNTSLDAQGFAAFAKVVEGMDVVDKLNSEYGESLTSLQGQIYQEGNMFLAAKAPRLDFIKTATILP
jgi:peptidyl-prolyl cis-trans isomerase A (cyclophilin A)